MTRRDESDLRQLARTLAAGLQFFITRDEPLLAQAEHLYEKFGISILRPSELIIHLDELRQESEYQPVRLAGTLSEIKLINKSDDQSIIETFLATSRGENKESFKRRLYRFLSDPENYRCYVSLDTERLPFAVIVYGRHKADTLEIPLLRIRRGPLAATMTRYLIFHATWRAALEKRDLSRMFQKQ
jgi:hypothetical protein